MHYKSITFIPKSVILSDITRRKNCCYDNGDCGVLCKWSYCQWYPCDHPWDHLWHHLWDIEPLERKKQELFDIY